MLSIYVISRTMAPSPKPPEGFLTRILNHFWVRSLLGSHWHLSSVHTDFGMIPVVVKYHYCVLRTEPFMILMYDLVYFPLPRFFCSTFLDSFAFLSFLWHCFWITIWICLLRILDHLYSLSSQKYNCCKLLWYNTNKTVWDEVHLDESTWNSALLWATSHNHVLIIFLHHTSKCYVLFLEASLILCVSTKYLSSEWANKVQKKNYKRFWHNENKSPFWCRRGKKIAILKEEPISAQRLCFIYQLN